MILRKGLSMRRLVASKVRSPPINHRYYHAGSRLNADALDMSDSFARRHSEFQIPCWILHAWPVLSLAHIFIERGLKFFIHLYSVLLAESQTEEIIHFLPKSFSPLT
jgi:hypothetical protein